MWREREKEGTTKIPAYSTLHIPHIVGDEIYKTNNLEEKSFLISTKKTSIKSLFGDPKKNSSSVQKIPSTPVYD